MPSTYGDPGGLLAGPIVRLVGTTATLDLSRQLSSGDMTPRRPAGRLGATTIRTAGLVSRRGVDTAEAGLVMERRTVRINARQLID